MHGPVRQLERTVPRALPPVSVAKVRRGRRAVVGPSLAEEHAAPGVGGEVRLLREPARVRVVARAEPRDAVARRGELRDHEVQPQHRPRASDGGFDVVGDARRASDVQWFGIPAVHAPELGACAGERADETREAEDVVAVHVRDEDAGDLAVLQVRAHELVLCCFAAVEEPDLVGETQGVGGDVARE